jgi:nucleoside-diphosphate-sugar epimerase
VVRADLAKKETLLSAVEGVDVIVHFAGLLFKAGPEKFLPETNTQYFRNLVDSAILCGVHKVILISFPHVEGPTSTMHPARGRLDGAPISIHARTRLEEERYLFDRVKTPVSLRSGMVYGKGILMVDAARWLSERRLLGVWTERTQIHLISKVDFCTAVSNAICKSTIKGIYHLGDEGKISLQEFLEAACKVWGTRRPWRVPLWTIYTVAEICELFSGMFGTKSPLTKDFIDIGRVSYYGDTTRMREELLSCLQYPTIHEGKIIL